MKMVMESIIEEQHTKQQFDKLNFEEDEYIETLKIDDDNSSQNSVSEKESYTDEYRD